MERVLVSIFKLLGFPAAFGETRKYLLKDFDPTRIPSSLGKEKFVEKLVFLKPLKDGERRWVKCRISDEGGKHITLTHSKLLDPQTGKRIKTRMQISPDTHEKLVTEEMDQTRPRVQREIFCFIYDDRGFFVKSYELPGGQGNLSFLVFNRKFENEEPDLPQFLDVVRDVTYEQEFFSYNVTSPDFVLPP